MLDKDLAILIKGDNTSTLIVVVQAVILSVLLFCLFPVYILLVSIETIKKRLVSRRLREWKGL